MAITQTSISYYGLNYVEHAERDFQEMLDRLRARDNGCGSPFVNNSKRPSRYFNRNGRSRFLKEHRAEVVVEKKNKSKD